METHAFLEIVVNDINDFFNTYKQTLEYFFFQLLQRSNNLFIPTIVTVFKMLSSFF